MGTIFEGGRSCPCVNIAPSVQSGQSIEPRCGTAAAVRMFYAAVRGGELLSWSLKPTVHSKCYALN